MASRTDSAPIRPVASGAIFVALAIWNLLLAISFPIQGSVLLVRQGFYYRSIWFSLTTEMIGLYPHLGYLLAWPSRQVLRPGFSHIPWDGSGAGAIFELLVCSSSAILAVALFFRQRLAGLVAAVIALLVAAAQFQQVHVFMPAGFRPSAFQLSLRSLYGLLDHTLAIGAFDKLMASLISALLALTLFRILLLGRIRGRAASQGASSIASESGQRTKHFLFGTLLLSALMILVLAYFMPTNLSEYYGQRYGFSVLFQLLSLLPVCVAAAGLWITGDRFFVGIASGYATLFPILLLVTWYLELANPLSPLARIKAPVWIAVVVCALILAGAALMIYRNKNAGPAHQGKFSLGLIVSLAFLTASLDACNMHGFLRN